MRHSLTSWVWNHSEDSALLIIDDCLFGVLLQIMDVDTLNGLIINGRDTNWIFTLFLLASSQEALTIFNSMQNQSMLQMYAHCKFSCLQSSCVLVNLHHWLLILGETVWRVSGIDYQGSPCVRGTDWYHSTYVKSC